MTRRSYIIPTVTAALVLTNSAVCADVVTLNDGRQLTGTVENETPQGVTLRTPAGVIRLQQQQVEKVETSPSEANTAAAAGLIHEGKIAAAINLLQLNNQSEKLQPYLTREILENPDLMPAASPEDVHSLFNYFSRRPPSLPVRLFMGAIGAEAGLTSAAATLLSPITPSQVTSGNVPSDVAVRLLERAATAAFNSGSPPVLSAASALMEHLPASQGKRRASLQLKASQIGKLLKEGDSASAALLFSADSFEEMPGVYEPLLRQTIDLFAKRRPRNVTSEIATQLENVGLSLPADKASPLLQISSQAHALAGRYSEARRVADQLSLIDPDAGAEAQHRAEFLEKEAALPEGDALSRYQLASWARERNLLHEAARLLTPLRKHPSLAANVTLQLELLNAQQAKLTVAKLRELYEASRHDELVQAVDQFVKSGPPREFSVQALELKSLSEFEQWQQKQTEPERVESQFQQAERLANQGDYEQALSKLNEVELNHPASATSKQVGQLRDRIMRQRAVAERKRSPKPPGSAP